MYCRLNFEKKKKKKMPRGNKDNSSNMQRNSRSNGNLKKFKGSLKQEAQLTCSPNQTDPSYGSISLEINDVGYQSMESELRFMDTSEEIKEIDVEEKQESSQKHVSKIQKKDKINKVTKSKGKTKNVDNICKNTLTHDMDKIKTSSRSFSSSPFGNNKNSTNKSIGENVEKEGEKPYLGPYLLKKARNVISLGDNPKRAFELALRAKTSFESCAIKKQSLDYAMCLHLLASIYCNAYQYKEAIPLLESSIEVPNIELGTNHALAKFVGYMRLGDIYAIMSQMEKAITFYKTALHIQTNVLGAKDPRVGETCRYVAEAYIQAFEFDEAENLCKMALNIRQVNGCPSSIKEAADRRLLGLIYDSKGDYNASLEQYDLATMALRYDGLELEIATVNCNIGDAYLGLAQYEEAILCYKKALSTFISSKGKNHSSVAAVLVRLGELYNNVGKFGESNSYIESALEIYSKETITTCDNVEDVSNGLIALAAIYEPMNELDHALNLLQHALELQNKEATQKSKIAGIEAQIGVINYILGNYIDSYTFLKSSVCKFEHIGKKKSSIYAITINQLGIVCVQLHKIGEAAELFDEAKSILEIEYGLFHPDTLGVCSNLAGTYDALGRFVYFSYVLELHFLYF